MVQELRGLHSKLERCTVEKRISRMYSDLYIVSTTIDKYAKHQLALVIAVGYLE